MLETLTWWAAAGLLGAIAFPITFVFFHRLPDRGYAFTKVIGLLLLSYCLWIGATLGIYPNSRGSIILIMIFLAVVSAALAGSHRQEMSAFLRKGWPYILLVEGLFFSTFVLAVYLRSFAPEIQWGEKPFELAFVNAINRSEFFPPDDPWLSGHSISYYHFGYLMAATLTKLTGLGVNVTFYLTLSLVAALAATAVFGVVYNLLAPTRMTTNGNPAAGPSLMPRVVIFGLAGAGLLLLLSNLEGVFEMLTAHGIGSPTFYEWVGVYDLNGPESSNEWYPTKFWWWWRATRIGSNWDILEFPFFSFHFGDLHPHVLALPFTITAVAIALQLFRSGDSPESRPPIASAEGPDSRRPVLHPRLLLFAALGIGALAVAAIFMPRSWWPALLLGCAVGIVAGGVVALFSMRHHGRPTALATSVLNLIRHPWRLLLTALAIGALGFMNLWDLPTFFFLVTAAALVANWRRARSLNLQAVLDTASFGITLAIAAVLLYLPFYLTFHSSTEGPALVEAATRVGHAPINSTVTRPNQFLMVWLPLLWLGLSLIVARILVRPWPRPRPSIVALSVIPWLAPLAIWAYLVFMTRGPDGFADELTTRGPSLGTIAMLAVFLAGAGFAFARELFREHDNEEAGRSYLFALMMVGVGLLLILGPELYWVKDPLMFRVNTVFKLYFQAWMLLSIGGAVGLYYLAVHWRPRRPAVTLGRLCWAGLTVTIMAAALVYTVAATFERTSGFTNDQRMDGYVHVQVNHPDEYEATRWLNENVSGTPVTTSPGEAKAILEEYDVEYVYVGHLERETYGEPGMAKFATFMDVAYRNDSVIIYRMPREVETVVSAP
ncbi:MAG: hypothetical protein AMJ76_03465 [Dehalococcoidia bacterium SM23_28_1]|nr:MAG: hypothetical protein AMJ76_03465 [Dehalococcoidia bacterium SM23_28_1]